MKLTDISKKIQNLKKDDNKKNHIYNIGYSALKEELSQYNITNPIYISEVSNVSDINSISNTYNIDLGLYYNYSYRAEIDRTSICSSLTKDVNMHIIKIISEYIMYKDYLISYIKNNTITHYTDKQYSEMYFNAFKNIIPLIYDNLKQYFFNILSLDPSKYTITFHKLYSTTHTEFNQLSYFKQNSFSIPANTFSDCCEEANKLHKENKLFQPFIAFFNIKQVRYNIYKTTRIKSVPHSCYTYFPFINKMNCFCDDKQYALDNINEDNLPNIIQSDENIVWSKIVIGNLYNNLLVHIRENSTNNDAFILYNRYGITPKFIKNASSIPHISYILTKYKGDIVGADLYNKRDIIKGNAENAAHICAKSVIKFVDKKVLLKYKYKLLDLIKNDKEFNDELVHKDIITSNTLLLSLTSFDYKIIDNFYINITPSVNILMTSMTESNDVIRKYVKYGYIYKSFAAILLDEPLIKLLSRYIYSTNETMFNRLNIKQYIDNNDFDGMLNRIKIALINNELNYLCDIDKAFIYLLYMLYTYIADDIIKEFSNDKFINAKDYPEIYNVILQKNNFEKQAKTIAKDIKNRRNAPFDGISFFGNDIDFGNKIVQLSYFGNNNEFGMSLIDIY